MSVYLAFFSISTVLLMVSRILNPRDSKAVFFVFLALIFLFSGLRGIVGSDTLSYLEAYRWILDPGYLTAKLKVWEPAFLLSIWAHKFIFDSSFLYILFVSLFQTLLVWVVAKSSKDRAFFAMAYVLVFYLGFHFNITRAAFGVMIFACGVLSSNNRVALLLCVIGALFHYSMIIFFPLLLMRFNLPGRLFFYLSGFLVIVGFLLVFPEIGQKASRYIGYLASRSYWFLLYPLLLLANVLVTFILFCGRSKGFSVSSGILVASIVFSIVVPIGYRLVFSALFFYLFFCLQEVAQYKYRWVYVFFWAPILLTFVMNTYGMVVEKDRIKERLETGENLERASISTYIPYQFYWQDNDVNSIMKESY